MSFVSTGKVMKKENAYKFLYAVCIFLIIGFVVRAGVDYFEYDSALNSAPFYFFIIERAVEFILPSIAVFIAGKVMKMKYSKWKNINLKKDGQKIVIREIAENDFDGLMNV